MTKRREAEGLWQDSGGSASRAPGRVGKEYEMKKAMLFGFAVALSTSGLAKADPVGLSAYVDANGFIDVTGSDLRAARQHLSG